MLVKEVVGGNATIAEEKLEWEVIQVMRRTVDQQETETEEEAVKGMEGTTRMRIDELPLLVLLVPLGIQHFVKARVECACVNFD